MMVQQLTVFLENSEGRLAALTRVMAESGANMRSLTISETADYGLVRIICDDAERAAAKLAAADFRATVTDVMAIEVSDEVGGLAKLMELLDERDLDVAYGYCFSYKSGQALNVFKFSDSSRLAEVQDVIAAAGFRIVESEDL